MDNKIELLAPAGDFKCLITAINAGADAVYFGLNEFNMRARAKNFLLKDLPKIKKICDEKNIKKYLTLNTIIYDDELKKVDEIIKSSRNYIDAIICSDISVMLLCKKYNLPFHVSTQCSVSNLISARFYHNLGAERIVLARELSLEQIKKISEKIPVEIFIHGAMCLSISGRCLMSQFLFKESANRGKCLQPCRRFYYIKDKQGNELRIENHHVLSPKDLCTLPFIEEIKKLNVKALKIEGRNRNLEYINTVVKVYRKALDKKLDKKKMEESLNELNKVYNKGFSSGFYLGLPTSDDFSKTENSASTESKEFIGKIKHYYPKIDVGLIKLTNSLKIGDNIYIIGNKTGLIRTAIESMEINHKSINEAMKSQEIAIKLPYCRKNDEVYKIVNRNKQRLQKLTFLYHHLLY